MFDMHYDLLTKIYMCYKQNSLYKIENWVKNYNFNNVKGLIANLCFLSIDEMKSDYDPYYYDPNISVIEMFKISTNILKKYLKEDILVLTSIEGCDYLKDENDLVILKELGLNCIVPVWNNKSKFGSGIRSEKGLTEMGKRLINKAISLNIGIDLSHANERTFFDIVDIIKEARNQGMKPIVYASHSNVKALNDVSRNLTDEQLLALKNIDGLIGIVAHSNFTLNGSLKTRLRLKETNDYISFLEELKRMYIKHIIYVSNLLGDTNNIAISTDDMTFIETDPNYEECPIFDYSKIGFDLKPLLLNYYDERCVDDIMFDNAYKIYERLVNTKIKAR